MKKGLFIASRLSQQRRRCTQQSQITQKCPPPVSKLTLLLPGSQTQNGDDKSLEHDDLQQARRRGGSDLPRLKKLLCGGVKLNQNRGEI